LQISRNSKIIVIPKLAYLRLTRDPYLSMLYSRVIVSRSVLLLMRDILVEEVLVEIVIEVVVELDGWTRQ
jgi:hypothetical protein